MKRGLNQLDSQLKINAIFKKKQVEDKDGNPVNSKQVYKYYNCEES